MCFSQTCGLQTTCIPCNRRLSILLILFVFVFCLDQVTGGSKSLSSPCPRFCNCHGVSIDCSAQNFLEIPRNLPHNVERLNLKDNQITTIRRHDFKGLYKLRVLQLLDNQIQEIEDGSFDDLKALERLRLNRNKLRVLPERLFVNTKKLYRLDLSHNYLRYIGKDAFKGAVIMKNLQMDDNRITCIHSHSIRDLTYMKILTINKNNLTSLPKDIFARMGKLRTLRLSENPLNCDCRIAWLSHYLRTHTQLAANTRCDQPNVLHRRHLQNLRSDDFQCSNANSNQLGKECRSEPNFICPKRCKCIESNVDCSGIQLRKIPKDIPAATTELTLSRNFIEYIPARAFKKLHSLRRLDLSMNRISYLHPKAFDGLGNLNSLLMYTNRIQELPKGVFHGLFKLQVMLINTNNISCVPSDTFQDLGELNFVSMYENNIKSIANGTFSPLSNVFTFHLGKNPLICDCNLRWIKDYFEEIKFRPKYSYGPQCMGPQRLKDERLVEINARDFKCIGSEREITRDAGRCRLYSSCPKHCRCKHTRVDCSGVNLKALPDNIPLYTTELILSFNQIEYIPVDGIISKLTKLQILDLGRNKIKRIAAGAFRNNDQLYELDLSNNLLTNIEGNQLKGLRNLKSLRVRSNQITCINNDTFSSMRKLNELLLEENNIRCIMSGSFNGLRSLQTLKLDQNSFHCNCHLSWMPNFVRHRPSIFHGTYPICASPPLLANTMMGSLQNRNFRCEANPKLGCNNGIAPCCTKDAVSCDPSHYCPAKCKCEGNDRSIVRCNNVHLTEIPNDIPASTTKLYLSGNEISDVNATTLSRLPKLKTLDLSRNRIRGLGPNSFASLKNLETLNIGFNKLQCIDKRSFMGLKHLKALILQGNDISTIPFGAFDELGSINNVGFGQNPFYCDCNIKWLKEFFNRRDLDHGISICSGPDHMQSKAIYQSQASDFICPASLSEYPEDVARLQAISKCSPCAATPCKNNGNCSALGYFDFECRCNPGFHGKRCERQIDACFGEPCANGAACKVLDNYGRFTCICRPGYKGSRCQINIDDCAEHKCQNNATCEDGINAYKCACKPGFRGRYCEKRIRFCYDVNPCKNGGKCRPAGNDYQCECIEGWEGRNCEKNIDDCVLNNCRNGASCIDEVNSYTCKCRPGYEGKFCEQNVIFFPPEYPMSTSVCSNHNCKNGGRCQQLPNSHEYKCLCSPGYGGKLCEYLMTVSFGKKSYFKQRALTFTRGFNISLNLATTGHGGVIAYHGKDDFFLILDLYGGHVRLSYCLGMPPGVEGYSTVQINDGKFHLIEVSVGGQNATLKVDGVFQSHLMSPMRSKRLRKINATLFIGGAPQSILRNLYNKYYLRQPYGFAGCVQHGFINRRIINFGALEQAHKLQAGCPRFIKPPNPCRGHVCRNRGQCRMIPGSNRFKCNCRRGYTGRRCERVASCRRMTRMEYYIDPRTSCRSRKRLKIRSCRGECSSGRRFCCKPKRFKKRRVKFRCPSGRRYERRITLIRKCGCKPCSGKSVTSSRRNF